MFSLIYSSFVLVLLSPVQTNSFSKRLSSILIVFASFSPVHTRQRRIRFENTFITSVRMLKWTWRMCISIYRPTELARNILVPSATRLEYRWRVALVAPKNSNFFIGWQKMDAQQKWKLQSSTHPILLPARMAAGALYEKKAKQMATVPDRSEGIVKVSA